MKTSEELRKLYDKELKEQLSCMEPERKKVAKWKQRIWLSIIGLIALLLIIMVILPSNVAAIALPLILFIGLGFTIAFALAAKVTHKTYRKNFKEEIMKRLVTTINPHYEYNANGYVAKEDYLASGIIRKACDRYGGDDLVKGIIDKTPFYFSELLVEKIAHKTKVSEKEKRDLERFKAMLAQNKDNPELQQKLANSPIDLSQLENIQRDAHRTYKTVFKGLFFVAEFNKHLNHNTFVVPEKAHTNLLGGETKQLEDYGKLVKLENPLFEKHFSVYSSDQQEARYILTPKMMETIVNIYQTYQLEVSFSFVNDKVYCAIPMHRNMFEPTIKEGVKYRDIEEMYMLLGLIETIINEMNLNTRIWTKA